MSQQLSAPASLGPDDDDRPEVGRRYITLNVLALFGLNIAVVTPMALSLAIRVEQLTPDHEEYLGYVLGVGAISALFGPVLGVLSDRTRSRFGRRRPWIAGGMIVGFASLFILAFAPAIWILGLGWIIAQLGWGQVLGGVGNSQADRLPESQRGKVAGLAGVMNMMAAVIGVGIGGVLATQTLLLFLVPGVIAVVLIVPFVCFVPEEDSRHRSFDDALTARLLLSKYLYNPRRYPDFSWNWLGRFLFYFGLTLHTSFTAFFYASKLGVPVTDIGGIIALAGGLSVVATTCGAIGSGFVSDRMHRRKAFVLGGGALFGVGAVVMAVAPGLPVLLAGSFVCALGIGVFSAVDLALTLDVLPERDTDAGRFMGINTFATTIPQALAPIVAPAFLTIAASGTEKNYSLLYMVAAGFTIVGGLLILRVRSVR